MPTARLTKAVLKGLEPSGKTTFLWDEGLAGFGVRIAAGGKAAFVVQYREARGTKRVTLGAVDVVNLDRARARAQEILAAVALRQDPFPAEKGTPTFGKVADDFLAQAAAKSAPRTHADYVAIVDRMVRPTFEARPIGEITRADVEKWHEGMRSIPRRANYALTIVVAIFGFAVRRGIIGHHEHPALGIRKYVENKRDRYLTLEELARFGAALADLEGRGAVSPWAAAAIRLLVLTGARSGEVLALQWAHVDLPAGALRLPTSKTGAKVIVLSNAAQDVLRGVPKIEGTPWVIAGRRHGEAMTSLQRPFGEVCKAAGITGLRIHDLRHSAASIATSAGVGLPVVGKVLGQSQAYTTQRYSHVHDTAERAAVELIAAAAAPLLVGSGVARRLRK